MQRVKPYFGRYTLEAWFTVNYCEPLDIPEFEVEGEEGYYIKVANLKLANDPRKRPESEALAKSQIQAVLIQKFGQTADCLELNIAEVQLTEQSEAW